MAHDEASAGLIEHLTDTHLADRARLGEVVAFDELVRRHVGEAASFAAVVSGDAALAPEVAQRAFTDLCDQITSGGYRVDDPFVSGLLRSTRALALIAAGQADVHDRFTDTAAGRLSEPERSALWLQVVLGMDAYDRALALEMDETEVARLALRATDQLGGWTGAAHEVLSSVDVDLPPETAEAARATWRGWIATTVGRAAITEARDTRPFLTRIEPVTTKLLRGAAVVLLVAGGGGIIFGGGGEGGTPGLGRPAEAAAASVNGSGDGSGAYDAGRQPDRSRSRSDATAAPTGAAVDRPPTTTASGAGAEARSTKADAPATSAARPNGSTGSGTGSGTPVTAPAGPPAGEPGAPAPSPAPTPSPTPAPAPAPAPAPTPTPAPAPTPAPTPTPTPTAPAPSPVEVVTGIVGEVTGTLPAPGSLLGG